jgi:methylated-DNA-[protein]-cysteine S-methyltransferase
VDKIRRHLSGDLQDFAPVAVDLSGATRFTREVCEWIRAIPPGEVRTYGEVARAMGKPGAARAVGQALSRNPIGLVVPCHRVVGAGGLTGFSAPGGLANKERLLRLERARL